MLVIRLLIWAETTAGLSRALDDIQHTYGNYTVEGFSGDRMIIQLFKPREYKDLKHANTEYDVYVTYDEPDDSA
jgi:uncharacterized protein YebE (UPF0316 family)